MAEQEKTIDEDTKLRALGLFHLASDHYRKCKEFEDALAELLGYPEEENGYMGCLSDEIYDGATGSFERGLRNEGFKVKKAKAA